MQQLINLYQGQFQPKNEVLTAKSSTNLLIVACAFMTLLTVNEFLTKRNNHTKLLSTQSELEVLEKQVAQIKTRMEGQVVDPRLAKAVQQMERHYAGKKEILELIGKPLNNKQSKFSDLLEGLARQTVPGMWLVDVDVHSGGEQLSLHGKVLQPVLLPEFVGKLNKEAAYVGREFKTLMMERTEKNATEVEFSLTTDALNENNAALLNRNFNGK